MSDVEQLPARWRHATIVTGASAEGYGAMARAYLVARTAVPQPSSYLAGCAKGSHRSGTSWDVQ
jgi:hypothetical protein